MTSPVAAECLRLAKAVEAGPLSPADAERVARLLRQHADRVAYPPPVTSHKLRQLSWAVGEASFWLGSLTGNPDRTEYLAYEAKVLRCRRVLRDLRTWLREERKAVTPVVPSPPEMEDTPCPTN